jgi:Carbamoyltransferase C-terminus
VSTSSMETAAVPACDSVSRKRKILEAKPETVSAHTNPRHWHLIDAFRDLTGVPMVLNTSFNENEPVVCTPEEALDCFLRTSMDVFVPVGGRDGDNSAYRTKPCNDWLCFNTGPDSGSF